MTGTFTNHVRSTIGSDASDKATAEAIQLLDESFELIGLQMDAASKDSPFAARDLAKQLRDSVASGIVQVPSANPESTPAAMIGAGTSDTSSPSIEEELGTELLKTAGNEGAARKLLSLARTINNGGPGLQGIVVLIAEDIRNGNDQIVSDGNRYRLKSVLDAEQIAETNATLVYDLSEAVCGYVTSGETPQRAVAEAKKELARKTAPAPKVNQDDTYLETLERISRIQAKSPHTTFEQHLRVVLDEFQRAGVVFADRLKHHSNIEYQTGTPIVGYVDSVVKSLRPATPLCKELDAIGQKVGEDRSGEGDDAYGRRLVIKINGMTDSVNALDKDAQRAAAIYKANGSTPALPQGVTPVGILELVIREASDTSGVLKMANGMKKITLP
ncbi:hypothetical protein PV379_02680 [Streptomyces caniscabiei]|uniref:hypothetical protein n=1 Tax=Streptomyces caniscabiei TaxID=2746961 RepID=UPI0029A18332|nr:hypothetical protein [Streptomyces caniscabiei]MDX2776261.1 hypothetical protein [Streptomyces caniscabiei]